MARCDSFVGSYATSNEIEERFGANCRARRSGATQQRRRTKQA